MNFLVRWMRALAKEQGFTLVELLVSIVILAVGIIGIMSLFPQSYKHIGNAGHVSTMNHIGQMKLDQLKTLTYAHSDLLAGLHTTTYDNYTLYWTVSDNQPIAGMKRIRLEIGHQLYDVNGTPLSSKEAMNQRAIYFDAYMARP
jgi:prepilin-type N-terminal cleavage/methylation domain-containing protein